MSDKPKLTEKERYWRDRFLRAQEKTQKWEGRAREKREEVKKMRKAWEQFIVKHEALWEGAKYLKDLVEKMANAGTHGYNPQCICEPCKDITSGLTDAVKSGILDDPTEYKSPIILPGR